MIRKSYQKLQFLFIAVLVLKTTMLKQMIILLILLLYKRKKSKCNKLLLIRPAFKYNWNGIRLTKWMIVPSVEML